MPDGPVTRRLAVVAHSRRDGREGLSYVTVSTADVFIQAAIAVLVISNPVDPVKILIFNSVIAERGLSRRAAALRVSLIVLAILAVTALIGREILQLIGINLGAFGVIGGLIVIGMGFEMLAGGGSSRVQGTRDTGGEEDGLIMPLATPLMAGPGTITTVITVSSLRGGATGVIAALVAVAIAAIAVFISFAYLGKAFEKLKPSASAMLARVGGLLLATIGAQLFLGGIRTFYGF